MIWRTWWHDRDETSLSHKIHNLEAMREWEINPYYSSKYPLHSDIHLSARLYLWGYRIFPNTTNSWELNSNIWACVGTLNIQTTFFMKNLPQEFKNILCNYNHNTSLNLFFPPRSICLIQHLDIQLSDSNPNVHINIFFVLSLYKLL